MLQPSLSGNARISVICTINPDPSAVTKSTSSLLFAQRIKKVQLNAQKEVVDTDALIERCRKAHNDIEDLKKRLMEREWREPVRARRLSAREVCYSLANFFVHWELIVDIIANGRVEGDERLEWKDSAAHQVDSDESDCR